jgi:hypothetical protein
VSTAVRMPPAALSARDRFGVAPRSRSAAIVTGLVWPGSSAARHSTAGPTNMAPRLEARTAAGLCEPTSAGQARETTILLDRRPAKYGTGRDRQRAPHLRAPSTMNGQLPTSSRDRLSPTES